MNHFNIHLPVGTFSNDYSALYGEVYVEIKSFFFPCEHWNDFVLSCVSTWTNNLLKLESESSNKPILFFFFDGSYHFSVQHIPNSKVLISFFDAINDDDISVPTTFQTSIDYLEFKKAILEAARVICVYFSENKKLIKKYRRDYDLLVGNHEALNHSL